jgi:hypothetical protein
MTLLGINAGSEILLGFDRKRFNTEDTDTNGVSRKALRQAVALRFPP